MLHNHFHLERRPFTSVPSPDQYYAASSIEQARASLVRLIERSEGPGLVVGGVGIGKSILCKLIAESFRHRCRVISPPAGRLSGRRDLLQVVLYELGLPYRKMEESELRLSLIDHVTNTDHCPNGILLLVDEADHLSSSLLDELRSFTNLATSEGEAAVRLVLFGTSRLEEKFTDPRLASFNQRIAGRYYLEPFSRNETSEFVQQHINSCGGDAEKMFTDSALVALHQATDGIPRLVNQLANHVLVLAMADQSEVIDETLVSNAWADLQQLPAPTMNLPISDTETAIVEYGILEPEHSAESALDSIEANMELASKIETETDDLETDDLESVEHQSTQENISNFDASSQDIGLDASDFSEFADFEIDEVADEVDAHEENAHEEIDNKDIDSDALTDHEHSRSTLASRDDAAVNNVTPRILSDETIPVRLAANPFEHEFDEELIVVDHFVSPDAMSQRHRRTVQHTRSIEYAEALDRRGDAQVQASTPETTDSPSSFPAAFTANQTVHLYREENESDEPWEDETTVDRTSAFIARNSSETDGIDAAAEPTGEPWSDSQSCASGDSEPPILDDDGTLLGSEERSTIAFPGAKFAPSDDAPEDTPFRDEEPSDAADTASTESIDDELDTDVADALPRDAYEEVHGPAELNEEDFDESPFPSDVGELFAADQAEDRVAEDGPSIELAREALAAPSWPHTPDSWEKAAAEAEEADAEIEDETLDPVDIAQSLTSIQSELDLPLDGTDKVEFGTGQLIATGAVGPEQIEEELAEEELAEAERARAELQPAAHDPLTSPQEHRDEDGKNEIESEAGFVAAADVPREPSIESIDTRSSQTELSQHESESLPNSASRGVGIRNTVERSAAIASFDRPTEPADSSDERTTVASGEATTRTAPRSGKNYSRLFTTLRRRDRR